MFKDSIIINTKTQEEHDRLMVYLEKQGYFWNSGKPTDKKGHNWRNQDSCIRIPPYHTDPLSAVGKTLNFDCVQFYKEHGCKIIGVNDYIPTPNLNLNLIQAIRKMI